MAASVAFLVAIAAPGDDTRSKNEQFRANCGVCGLYLLLKSQGVAPNLQHLAEQFPTSSIERGVSPGQIMAVAEQYGVKLGLRRLQRSDWPWTRPSIFCVEVAGLDPHFVFVEPCVESRYLQIINVNDIPRLLDVESAFQCNEWKGLALMPIPSHPLRDIGWIGASVAMTIAAGGFVWHWRRALRNTPQMPVEKS